MVTVLLGKEGEFLRRWQNDSGVCLHGAQWGAGTELEATHQLGQDSPNFKTAGPIPKESAHLIKNAAHIIFK